MRAALAHVGLLFTATWLLRYVLACFNLRRLGWTPRREPYKTWTWHVCTLYVPPYALRSPCINPQGLLVIDSPYYSTPPSPLNSVWSPKNMSLTLLQMNMEVERGSLLRLLSSIQGPLSASMFIRGKVHGVFIMRASRIAHPREPNMPYGLFLQVCRDP